MNLTQLTDSQLIDMINGYGERILATFREEQPMFDELCLAYDTCQAELDNRGLW